MSTCRLCAQDKKLLKAHVIPESFFRAVRGTEADPPPLLITAGQYPRRAPIGVYDQGILCSECEARFGDLDAFGAKVFLHEFDALFAAIRAPGGGIVGYEAAALDARLVLRFLVSVLWRASVSAEPFYARVDLGALEPVAARFALDDADDDGLFDAVLARWPPAEAIGFASHGVMDPIRHRYDGVNAYRMYFGETLAEIKVDRQPFPRNLADLGLRAAPPIRVVVRDFERSKDLAVMKKTANLALRPRRRDGH